jgi:glycosyltransferase involved in cell wall biosynthesis
VKVLLEFHILNSILDRYMDDKPHSTTEKEAVNPLHKKPFVLHVITRASWGGAQRYVYDMATDTTQYIQAVATEAKGTLVDELRKEGVTVYPLSYVRRSVLPLHDIRTLVDLVQLLRRVRPDIVHLHSSKMGFIGGIACRMVGIKKIIFTIHGWPYNEQRSAIVLFIFKLLSFVILMCVHQAIAVSKAVIKTRPFGFGTKKITQVYLAIKEPKYKEREKARAILLRKTTLHTDSETVLFGIVGELTRNKGHEILLRAFKEVRSTHPQVKLICIGNGGMFSELHTLTRELSIENDVAWIHNLNDAALFMKAFDVVITSSYTEALGYAQIEAGRASVARIATNVGGLPEIVHNKVNGLLVPREDSHALARALITCVEDKNLRDRLGAQAYIDLEPFINLKKMRSQIYEIYGE